LAKARRAVSLGVSALIVIALIVIAGFGAFLGTTLSTSNNNHSTGSVSSQSSSSSSQGISTSYSSSESNSAKNFQVINSNLTVYYGTACVVVGLFQLSCPTMNAALHSPSLSNVELVSSEGFYYYAINFTFSFNGQPISHTVWFTNSTVFCVSPEYGSYNVCPSQVQLPETFAIPMSVNSSMNALTGLRLDLNLSTDPSSGLIVKLDEYNTLGSANNVSAANQWQIPKDNLTGYCTTNLMGFAVYMGNYELNNYTLGEPLALNPPNVQMNCSLANQPTYYLFDPDSSLASISPESNFPSTPSKSMVISESNSMAGYWTGTKNSPLFNYFLPGVYTIVAVDEWGQVVLLHFDVSLASQDPVQVISVVGPVPPITPAGPAISVTLKNVAETPIISLSATLKLPSAEPLVPYSFNFSVNSSNPLLQGQSVESTLTAIGAGFVTDASYPLVISGMLANGLAFNYTQQVIIVPPS